ncbi:hypothetical protein AGDE_13803 [Angomonas deanei]|uniref:ATP-dependent DNA helicase n=1 Tax=Angomonas deanei TaxID=59799 RepID=A0A7G2CST4_9TRYP|nr:hypothetical protein AGDE_13803 [Angomonas deanei]CAD2222838.1 AAA domain/PIF1-like helicase, putative [Angomonas deanei]|eukprot:EPY21758.1 hypothetical protein AGDE_13803 [Angomonas deanei]
MSDSTLRLQRRYTTDNAGEDGSTEEVTVAKQPSPKKGKGKKKLAALRPEELPAHAAPTMQGPSSAPQLVEPPIIDLQQEEGKAAVVKPKRKRRTKKEMEEHRRALQEAAATEEEDTTTTSTEPVGEVKADATASQEFSLDEFDNLSQDDFFAKLTEEENSRSLSSKLGENTLVYNALNGRMVSENSPSVLLLKSIGFGINHHRQMYVEHPEQINELAAGLRAGTTPIPTRWPVSLQRTLGTVLMNKSIPDPAEAIAQMMQIKINSITRSRYASVVTAPGDDPANPEVSDVHNLLEDSSDPTKTIELNEEQERVISLALRGHHMYIGGSAGTGKTVLLRILSRRLQAHRLRVAMTATTGVAGCHIGGSTFHHAMGVVLHGGVPPPQRTPRLRCDHY